MTKIQQWGRELGFSQIGVVRLASLDLTHASQGLRAWLAAQHHGDMHYMAAHATLRENPQTLVPETISILTARMDYLPQDTEKTWRQNESDRLRNPQEAVISIYARGRDYHKIMRKRLQQLSERMACYLESDQATQNAAQKDPPQNMPRLKSRVFVDSGPVFEVELASRSELGWRGKHTLLLQKKAGSMFFLGEIFINLDLAVQDTSKENSAAAKPAPSHCGTCHACISACPTQAIIAPYRLDATRCISYLTIEHKGEIPLELRRAIGNRIYGCDDCQTACPWNKFAQRSVLTDFDVREGMQDSLLLELFLWDEATFLRKTEGSAIRRIGYERWQRNLAVALGNALQALPNQALKLAIRQALIQKKAHATLLVKSHIEWALRVGT